MRSIPFYGGVVALLAYMPLHVFLVQFLSSITGGLNAWKAGVDVYIALLSLFTFCLIWKQGSMTRTFKILAAATAGYAALHLLEWAAHPHIYATSAAIGTAYNVRILCFVFIGYSAALLKPGGIRLSPLLKFVVIVSTFIAALGILQYFLPSNFLTHFGYSTARGARPAFFIDNNAHYIRSMATLRDPNSLGAYLVLPVALLTHWLVAAKSAARRRWRIAALLAVQLTALALTFSRSAWLAVLLTEALVLGWRWRVAAARLLKTWWPALVVALVLLGVGVFAERHQPFVKSYLIHSTGKPQGQYDSDGFHWYYVKRGMLGIWHDPIGHGPGTAGLASIQNPAGGLLTENYYVQVGYELGVLGLVLFVALNVYVYVLLTRRRPDALGTALLASFWGYVIINMLLHDWSNEAVSAQWWLLAGVAIAFGSAQRFTSSTRNKNK